MTTEIDTIKKTTDLFALVEKDTHLKRVGANWFAGPCPNCGGRDRFVLKRTTDGWRWLCRHCTGRQYRDAIDYVMMRDGLPFKDAVERLGGRLSPLRLEDPPAMQKPKPEPQEQAPSTVERLTEIAYRAVNAIDADTPLAQQVRAYLHSRGFIEPTIRRALLGAVEVFDPKAGRKRPAASIPYFDTALNVRAIKYRFVGDDPNGLRYVMEKGSRAGFYYLPEHLGYHDCLMVTEGELNLLALAQVMVEADLVCTGSQSLSDAMRHDLVRLAGRYRQIWVWFDEPQKAREVAMLIIRGIPVQSPLIDGCKWDANSILQADRLHTFITRLTGLSCRGWRLAEWRAHKPQGAIGEINHHDKKVNPLSGGRACLDLEFHESAS